MPAGLIAAHMRRLMRDAPLRKSRLKRTLALLRDIPGQTVDARLRQSGAPGDLLIDLIVKRKQVQIGLTIDNSGVSNVVQAQMSVTVNGLAREGDSTRIAGYLPFYPDRYQYYSLSHSTPIGCNGLTLAAQSAHVETRSSDSRTTGEATLAGLTLSRLLALAQLPEEVVNAFATPDELRVRYSEILTPLLRRPDQRARMIAEAQSIGEQQQALARDGGRMLSPATVLARLRDAATPQPLEEARDMAIVAGGARIGRPRPGRSGGPTIDLSISEYADLDELLARLRETIVAARAAPVMQ